MPLPMLPMLPLIASCIALCCEAVHAQQVFKCSTDTGVSYQSAPCDGAPLKTWAAHPETVDVRIQARLRAIDRELRRNRPTPPRQLRSTRSVMRSPLVDDACEQARHGRAQAYAKAGLARDFRLSSHWDNQVHSACW